MRPVIGITASLSTQIDIPELREKRLEHQYLYNSYVRAVWMAGGLPLIIPVGFGGEACSEMVKKIDGLLLPGGVDVDPAHYHHTDGPNQTRIDKAKDETEILIARAAMERWIPVFGICRGMQLLAVAAGGNLIQDIATDLPWAQKHSYPEDSPDARHEVTLREGSALRFLIGTERTIVNTLHHQAVGEIPDGWRTTAHAADGVAEGMEYSINPLIFAVQWHPEIMVPDRPDQLGLFKAFIKSAVEPL